MTSSSASPIVLMGVSGAGKSAVGEALAQRLGRAFIDGDSLHPKANVDKMHAGHPLNDADRAPWLDRVADWLAAHAGGGIVACSALKRCYRERLRQAVPGAVFVLLDPPIDVLRRRTAGRQGHFMPSALLDSQLATLERPAADERAIIVSDTGTIADTVTQIVTALDRRAS